MNQAGAFEALLATPEPADLRPGPRKGVLSQAELDSQLTALFRQTTIEPQRQQLVQALLLLWHDHLDSSHSIAQGIPTQDGSMVHAIMHRREPDYWNSKYWWRRVGTHPCFLPLAQRVSALLTEKGDSRLLAALASQGRWDAFAFVDACEAAADQPIDSASVEVLREVQRVEFETVLTHFLGAVSD